jgi:xanthine dehydrogenase iron-sulfur cluster and FAD-binding subunit A
MVVGNTELGIEMTIGKRSYPTMIQSNKVSELTKITVNEEGVCAGASVTWSSLEEFLLKLDQPSYKTRIYYNIVQMLR